MHWTLWLLLANIFVAFTEQTYRNGQHDSFYTAMPYVIVPILLAQVCLFYGFRGASSLMFAGVVFTLTNVLFRVANTYYLGEHLSLINWAGVVMLVGSAVLLKWR
jgi:drug/metabolite transporter (DMT)-like permease